MAQGDYGTIPTATVAPATRNRWKSRKELMVVGIAVTAVVVIVSAGSRGGRPVLLEGDEQPVVAGWPGPYTAVPYMHDPKSGITQWTATPLPPPAAPMLPAMYPMAGAPPIFSPAGPPMLPGAPPPAYGIPPSVNTWSTYPYGPLPPAAAGPLPGLQPQAGPMYGPPATTQIVFNSSSADDRHIEINIPQPPTMVSFPPVKLDPNGAPFGSTPNTAEAFNAYTQSTGFGAALMPAINMSYSSKPVRILPPPNAPVTVDLFTGTGPNDEPPYHIAGTTAGFYQYQAPKNAAKKQERLQALYNDYVTEYLATHRLRRRSKTQQANA